MIRSQNLPNPAQPAPMPALPAPSDADTPAPALGLDLVLKDDETLPAVSRLVVLVPLPLADDSALARRIWSLASPRRLKVLYLGLCRSRETESRARRQLATLAAVTRDDWATVDIRLDIGADWVRAARAVYRPGDLIVCHAEQRVGARFRRGALGDALASALQTPVCILSGYYPGEPAEETGIASRVLSWVIPAAIVIGFFILQIRIEQLPKDWAHTGLLGLSVVVETALIGLWSHYALL